MWRNLARHERTRLYAGAVLTTVVAAAGIALLARRESPLADAVSAVFTAIAAVFTAVSAYAALKAAQQSMASARESNRALAMHYKPEATAMFSGGPAVGEPVLVSVWFGKVPVAAVDVEIRWQRTDGIEGRHYQGAPDPNDQMPMPGVTITHHHHDYPVAGLAWFEVRCVDSTMRTRWRDRRDHDFGGGFSVGVARFPLQLKPVWAQP